MKISIRKAYEAALTSAAELIRGQLESGGIIEEGEFTEDEYRKACIKVHDKITSIYQKFIEL